MAGVLNYEFLVIKAVGMVVAPTPRGGRSGEGLKGLPVGGGVEGPADAGIGLGDDNRVGGKNNVEHNSPDICIAIRIKRRRWIAAGVGRVAVFQHELIKRRYLVSPRPAAVERPGIAAAV